MNKLKEIYSYDTVSDDIYLIFVARFLDSLEKYKQLEQG
ncbi:hypothetical protein CPK_ORF00390 [Chlamydia pneumoniae LPCoLN]|nr:hypothetical protein CPK_ORF00390 [Chlamydia pneumoniae LPCoLN]